MKHFIVHLSNGVIVRKGGCSPGDFDLQAAYGESVVEGDVADTHNYRIIDGVIVHDPRPTDAHVRSASGEWVDGRTPDDIRSELTNVVQAYLDATARTRNYDGILSLCSYASSPHPKFGPEGRAGVAWRDAVWAKCYEILADVEAQVRPVPSEAELLAEMPAMVWPE